MRNRPNMKDSKVRKYTLDGCYKNLINGSMAISQKKEQNRATVKTSFNSLTRKVKNINDVDNEKVKNFLEELNKFTNLINHLNTEDKYYTVIAYLNKRILASDITDKEAVSTIIKYVDPNYELLLKNEEEIVSYLKDLALLEKRIFINELRNVKYFMEKYSMNFEECVKYLIKIARKNHNITKDDYKEEEHKSNENFEYFSKVYNKVYKNKSN